MSISLGTIPRNLPEEFKQVRIENSPLFELPQGSFINMSTLEYLWLNFNNVTVIHLGALEHLSELKELRLEGNKLRSVPWTAFRATPLLRVLDLKHNRIDVLPELALQFLVNLTYLDLSSNRLTVVSKSVFLNWPAYQKRWQPGCGAEILSSMVLALHNNPWLCDCRLRGLIQFVKSIRLPVILVNPYLLCRGPLSKAGHLFHETELSICMKPQISTSSANVSIQIGQNVTLRCLAQASPSPTISWTYPLSTWREFDGKLHAPSWHIWGNGEVCSHPVLNREVLSLVSHEGRVQVNWNRTELYSPQQEKFKLVFHYWQYFKWLHTDLFRMGMCVCCFNILYKYCRWYVNKYILWKSSRCKTLYCVFLNHQISDENLFRDYLLLISYTCLSELTLGACLK